MDPRVTEFQCIMPLKNIPSVLKHGILSNERADEVPHESLAMESSRASASEADPRRPKASSIRKPLFSFAEPDDV